MRPTDKFCLYCGEPLLKTGPEVQEPEPAPSTAPETPQEDTQQPAPVFQFPTTPAGAATGPGGAGTGNGRVLFPQTTVIPAEINGLEDELASEADKESQVDSADAEAKPFTVSNVPELDPEVKADIQARIDLFHLAKKIKKINSRLKESIALMEDEDFKKKYDFDDEFRKQNAIRFEALKQIATELKEKKQEIEKNMLPENKLVLQNQAIKRLKNQLIELNNSFRMKKIERAAYDMLHDEYKTKLQKLLDQRKVANFHLGMWVGSKKNEIEDLENQIELEKGRKVAKEISKEEFKKRKEELQKKIQKLKEDIKIIQKFIFED